jgi:hypothetical protein
MDEQQLTSLTNTQSATAMALRTSAESMRPIWMTLGDAYYHCSYGMNNVVRPPSSPLETAPLNIGLPTHYQEARGPRTGGTGNGRGGP